MNTFVCVSAKHTPRCYRRPPPHCTLTHTHTHSHMHRRTCMHTCTHARMHMQSCTRAHSHIHVHTHSHTYMYMCTHVCVHARTFTHVLAHICTHTCTRCVPFVGESRFPSPCSDWSDTRVRVSYMLFSQTRLALWTVTMAKCDKGSGCAVSMWDKPLNETGLLKEVTRPVFLPEWLNATELRRCPGLRGPWPGARCPAPLELPVPLGPQLRPPWGLPQEVCILVWWPLCCCPHLPASHGRDHVYL